MLPPQAHFWLLPLGLLAYPARASVPPLVPFLPFYPHSKPGGCSESLCLPCLRLETKEGMESKVLGPLASISDQDPLLCPRRFSNWEACGHLCKALLQQHPCLVARGPGVPFCPSPPLQPPLPLMSYKMTLLPISPFSSEPAE